MHAHPARRLAELEVADHHRERRRVVVPHWLRTNGVNTNGAAVYTNGAAAKVMNFDRLGKRERKLDRF